MNIRFALALTLTLLLTTAGFANAEYSVSYTYNDLFNTNLSNSDLVGTAPGSSWTLQTMDTLQVMVMDTGSTADVKLIVAGGPTHVIYDTGTWTSPTRGYGVGKVFDLAGDFGITATDTFSLYVGSVLISDANARLFAAPNPTDGFLLGFNDNGGWSAGDGDMNEPLIYGRTSATPIPGAAWLLGTGLVGLVGLRRKSV